jgi:hypothetical protein
MVLAGLAVGAAALVAIGVVRAVASAATAVVALLLAVLVLPVLSLGASSLDDVRDGLKEPDPAIRHEKCFFDAGRQYQLGFLTWVQGRIPPGDTFAIDSRDKDQACFQLNMLPSRLVRLSDEPAWILRMGRLSAELRDRNRRERNLPRDERTVLVLRPGFALIRER